MTGKGILRGGSRVRKDVKRRKSRDSLGSRKYFSGCNVMCECCEKVVVVVGRMGHRALACLAEQCWLYSVGRRKPSQRVQGS